MVGPRKNYSLHASADSDELKPQSRLFYDFLVARTHGGLGGTHGGPEEPQSSGREPSGKPFSSGGRAKVILIPIFILTPIQEWS